MKRLIYGRNVLLSVACLLAVSFNIAQAQEKDLLNQVDPNVEFSTVERDYDDLNAEYAREGTSIEIEELSGIVIGQSQTELQSVLGDFAVEYRDGSLEFHLALPLTDSDRLVCQYRVFFDSDDKVESAIWRRSQCANLVLGQL